MLLTNWMEPSHLNGRSFFPLHIVSFEILTFIEIEIFYTTGVHQLKYDFYYQLFIKMDFYKFSALVRTKKKNL